MIKYNHKKIERKWQKKWDKSGIYKAKDFSKKPKYYCLIEFPYPSGAGLHVGHVRSQTAIDIVARKKRMSGYNVLYPIGWDAFGLPTENFAIKTKTHPKIVTKKNIKYYKWQIKNSGMSFDWSREIDTTDPKYYKWTQWIFLKFFNSFYDEKTNKAKSIEKLKIPKSLSEIEKKEFIDNHKMAYEAKMAINWCPKCKIGLANEEVVGNNCERCGAIAEKKIKRQWMLRITKYAERLIKDLDTVDYLDKIKTQQINWIGKSEGAIIKFKVKSEKLKNCLNSPLERGQGCVPNEIEIFTTRPDTIFGCTYIVLAPEHPLVANCKSLITNYKEVEEYIQISKNKSDMDRTDLAKEKTGVELKGIKAINPASGEEILVWIADYVLASYGTGAIMAVPAHDERDFEFAKKFGIDIKYVVKNEKEELSIDRVFTEKGIAINSGNFTGLKTDEFKNKIIKWLEENKLGKKSTNYKLRDWVFSRQHYWGEPIPIIKCKNCGLKKMKIKMELNFRVNEIWNQIIEGKKTIETRALNPEEKNKFFGDIKVGDFVKFNNKNTGEFEVARIKKTYNFKNLKELFEIKGIIEKVIPNANITKQDELEKAFSFTNDYLERIEKNGLVGWEFELLNITENISLSEKDLPLELPNVKNYEPTETGESPLANITKWTNVKCPVCKGNAKRETDTMPNWAGSSWYCLAYLMQGISNFQFPISKYKKAFDYWMPVDLYNGGMEHTTLHLLYSRFWHKFLFDLGYVNAAEPYKMRRSHGMILAEDGVKMSKSKGNVINPDDIIKNYGADTLRLYEMFIGPYSEAIPWSTTSLIGMNRFLEKIWNMQSKISSKENNKEKTFLVATNNKGKLKELKDHLKNYNILSLEDIKKTIKEPIENGKTFKNNSLIKAKYYAQKTGYLTIADDSGLCVNALDGRPGVFSSRYAEGSAQKGYEKLLKELENMSDRSAYFQSVITLFDPASDKYEQFEGTCEGNISNAPSGENGFGYDPVFIPKGLDKSFGKCSPQEKYSFDHRKKAIDKLMGYLSEKEKAQKQLDSMVHKTIKKVTEDIDNLKFNTAISQLMILSNEFEKQDRLQITYYKLLITILSPFTPHITEELWALFENKKSIHLENWPKYDPELAKDKEIMLVIQINGKVRDQISSPADISAEDAKKIALESEKIKKWIEGKIIRKIIFVKGKLVNIVV